MKALIKLYDRLLKLEKEVKKFESGIYYNPIKKDYVQNKINELSNKINTIEQGLTKQQKESLNDYYQCEMFEI